ncbi:hypothetical protein D1AOALGA4SA_2172 [Olavius algarvensis Delta 1 endosymbiont]|nr:hypothetical protein D1AOALGA4SA_2172 [Olavius algarvensis Delta 1 endosymbiont]
MECYHFKSRQDTSNLGILAHFRQFSHLPFRILFDYCPQGSFFPGAFSEKNLVLFY